MGWFHATPRVEKQSKEKQVSRAEKIRSNGGTPLMPPCDAEYIVSWWHDLGLCSAGAMGAVSLSSVEIALWATLSGVELEPWEFNSLRSMSQNYVNSLHESDSPNAPPPYGTVTQEFDRNVVQKKLVGAFQAFIMAGKK